MIKYIVIVLYFVIFITPILARDTSEKKRLFNMTLEELLNLKVISSSSISQKFSFAPSVVTVITKEQIEYFGYNSVAECIASVAGIDLFFNYNQYNVGIRGITTDIPDFSRIFKLMINNVVVSFKSKGSDFLDEELIPISAIERIEIVRGPNAVTYGANAYLGVINIITKESNGESTEIEVKNGVYNKKISYGGEFYKEGEMLNFNYILSGDYEHRNFYKIKYKSIKDNKKGFILDNKDEDISIFSRFSKENIFGNDKINLQFIYQNQLTNVNFVNIGLFLNRSQEHLENYNISLDYNNNFSNKLHFESSITFSYGNPLGDDRFYRETETNTYYKRDFGYKSLQVNNRINWYYNKQLSMSFGIDNIWDDFDLLDYILVTDKSSESISALPFDHKKIVNTGIDYQLNYVFLKEKLNLNAGVRYDINSKYDNVFNHRIGVTFKLYSDVYIKLLAGSSYKPPEIIQLYSTLIKVGGILSNPDLKPQRAHFHEISLIKKVKNNLLLSFTYDRAKIYDHIIYKKMLGTTNLYPQNQSDIVSNSWEFEVNYYNIANMNLYFNYSFSDSRYSKELFNYYGENKKVVFEMNLYPKHMLKFGVTRKIDWFFKYISLEGSYFSKRIGSVSNILMLDAKNPFVSYKLDDYFLATLFVRTKDIKIENLFNMNMYAKIYNIFNSEFYYPGYEGYDFRGISRYFEVGFKFIF